MNSNPAYGEVYPMQYYMRKFVGKEPLTMGKQLVNFYHLRLLVECTHFCNLQRQEQTHVVLVIGLYELLGNTTT
jgi:SAM-dependent MidA family methyltransferase